jgi:Divergent InlB B-repeat domain
VGRQGAVRSVGLVRPRMAGNRVVYPHRGVSEWYANGPLGLEQGFVVRSRAVGGGPVALAVALRGNARPRLGDGAVSLGGGLRYSGLVVTDASGRAVRSWFELARGRVLIDIADQGAAYPLRVDPFVQGAKLTGPGETASGAQFGFSVALSSDGNTALIGGPVEFGAGAAWVFTRSGSTWTQQGNKLTGTAGFGSSVALSADGNTALIGGRSENRAWVFTRSGSTWTQQGNNLTGSDEVGDGLFGSSVALSSDGNTALIGGDYDNGGVGAAWVFTRSGSTWTQQGNKLTPSDEIGDGGFGSGVALSSDGNTALIGGPTDNGVGAMWVFTRSGSTWVQQGNKLTPSDEIGYGYFGFSVALSSDGNTALIGGAGAWVFTRSGSTWTQQGNKLTGNGGFGSSVALSSDGNTALIGGGGAAWVFTRSGSTWTQQGNKLTGTGTVSFGFSVALSSDANTALIGEPPNPHLSDAAGAALVFIPGHALSVTNAGTGFGTVTSSPTGIRCAPTCSTPYAVGTRVTLTAKPAAGSMFSGWSGGRCSGKGSCTVTISADRSVIARFTLKPPKITKANINGKRHTATFTFKAPGASRFQCALLKPKQKHKKPPKPHFLACRSPNTYKHLKQGKYTFEVRALSHGSAGPATKRRFTI